MTKYKKSFQESKSSFALCSTSSHNIKCLWSHKSNGSMVRSWSRRVTLLSRKLKLAGMKIPIMENWGNILLPFTSQHVTWDARLELEVRWGEAHKLCSVHNPGHSINVTKGCNGCEMGSTIRKANLDTTSTVDSYFHKWYYFIFRVRTNSLFFSWYIFSLCIPILMMWWRSKETNGSSPVIPRDGRVKGGFFTPPCYAQIALCYDVPCHRNEEQIS